MSRQYPNRPFVPPRRRVSFPMCDFVPYSTPSTNEIPPVNPPWRLTDPAPFLHQQQTLPPPPPPLPPPPVQTDFSYFQFPPHRRPVESPLLSSTHEVNGSNQHVHHFGEPHTSCHFHYSEPDDEDEQRRPVRPLSLVTAAATTTASAPHHRHYRLESPSAASFTRQPPWFDEEWEDNSLNMQRPSRRNSSHSKRQRSSAVSTPTNPQSSSTSSSSSSSQQYHQHHHHPHHERKRSRHEASDDNERVNHHHPQENALQQQQQQYRPSSHYSHHHYQPYPNHRPTPPQQQPVLMPRTLFTDNVTPDLRPFDQRSQQIQRNRIEYPHETNTASVHYGSHLRTAPPPVQPRQNPHPHHQYQLQQHQPREQRHFVLEPTPVPPPRRQATASGPRPSHVPHVHRNGIPFEQPHQLPQRGPIYHRPPMATHIHQRPSPSFLLTDLLHRVIDAHAASYGDDHAHYHHHPPSASIDLIAYAWMSPGHEIFSLPGAFSIQFGDFFDLTMPDETPVVGLTDSELERLTTMTYSKPCTSVDADDKCAVCLSEYLSGEQLKRLRCKHFFHTECIDPWLKTSTRCPICRGEQTC